MCFTLHLFNRATLRSEALKGEIVLSEEHYVDFQLTWNYQWPGNTLCYTSNTSIVFQLQNWWFQNSWLCLFTKKSFFTFSLTRYFWWFLKLCIENKLDGSARVTYVKVFHHFVSLYIIFYLFWLSQLNSKELF